MIVLNEIFEKPVERPIDGVIKADDNKQLRIEVEEYILTNEIEKRLESFLSAYNNYTTSNGVWISGFFGSGKSHLLKMLALVLENREIDGTPALELFLPKCNANQFLRAELERAVRIPSKSLLFNIDQKADVISKSDTDALLGVFMKVFDEMSGYFGKQGYVAQFERDLDGRGLYEPFKSTYKSIANKPWSKGREEAIIEAQNIDKAYAQVTGNDEVASRAILDKYRSEYKVSIEDFAEKVQAYIDTQPPNFRLNFFIDEVGQYIADNVKLMTNLQTIAESLATKSNGRAWIIVTAQEDMDSVVGEMTTQRGNDFSKIQARFNNRMKLTSADVAEVIQKRLLMKNEAGIQDLSKLYQQQANSFKTLFDFSDGSTTYKNFEDEDHFVDSYPFIPYQFRLFQTAIQNLSQYNAFEGQHSSVGERSMLGVFQQVAIQISRYKVGQLATFDLMFEGIRTALKSNIQSAIIQAETHLENPFAVKLLKALFLVKYVKQFKATVRNLSVLMYRKFDQDIAELQKSVEEALNLLEQQTYIQRNGDLYEYLTDEEKDVEKEIKNTEIQDSAVMSELETMIFDATIGTRKIRYEQNKKDYDYAKKLDDLRYGREHELAIHIISPFHEHSDDEAFHKQQNMGRDELLVLMPADERLMNDLVIYKQTDKFVLQNTSTTQKDTVKRIIADKSVQNRERYAEILQRVQMLLTKSKLFVNGTPLEFNAENPQTRINQGFQELITVTYPNLQMLRGIEYSEDDIPILIENAQEDLLNSDAVSPDEAEREMFAFIQRNNQTGVRTTIRTIIDKFERKPNGWYYAAILCTLAKLYARGKIDARSDSNLLDKDEMVAVLRNSKAHGNTVLEPQIEFTTSQIRALSRFYGDFFHAQSPADEAKILGQATSAAFKELRDKLVALEKSTQLYPFHPVLKPAIEQLGTCINKPYDWYLTELRSQEDELLDLKELTIDPIFTFVNGTQKSIFDEAQSVLKNQQSNFAYIDAQEVAEITAALQNPQCYQGNHMQQVKSQVDSLQQKISSRLDTEISDAKSAVAEYKERFCNMDEFKDLTQAQQSQLTQPFDNFMASSDRPQLIAVVRETLRRFEESEYQGLLTQMLNWAQPAAEPVIVDAPEQEAVRATSSATPSTTTDTAVASPPPRVQPKPKLPVQIISNRSIKVSFQKPVLTDEADVDQYLESLRQALLREIRHGKRIQL